MSSSGVLAYPAGAVGSVPAEIHLKSVVIATFFDWTNCLFISPTVPIPSVLPDRLSLLFLISLVLLVALGI